jgi:hypothetical protein
MNIKGSVQTHKFYKTPKGQDPYIQEKTNQTPKSRHDNYWLPYASESNLGKVR